MNPQMHQMMKQAQKLQAQMAKMQEELAAKQYEASAGGDMVKAVVNGKNELVSLRIQKEVVDPEDVGLLEDLVLTAVNTALKNASEDAQSGMKGITGGLKIPGLG